MINSFNDFNYLEINILNDITTLQNNIININWNEEKFNKLIIKFINQYKLRPFEKKFRICKHQDKSLILNINENKYYVNKLLYINHSLNDNHILIKYKKENLPPINFPSTSNINDTYYLNKIIFKITNRIYINFELKKKFINDEEIIFRRVYINLNNDKKNVDNNNINKELDKCINYF